MSTSHLTLRTTDGLARAHKLVFISMLMAVAVTLGLVSSNGPARACLPPRPGLEILRVLPLADGLDLPLDTRGIIHFKAVLANSFGPFGLEDLIEAMAPTIVDANGVAVDATVHFVSGARTTTVFITPNEPLLAETSYRVISFICPSCDGFVAPDSIEMTRFTTGVASVGSTPGRLNWTGGSASIEMCNSSSCCGGPGGSYRLNLRSLTPADDQLVRIEKQVDGAFEPLLYSHRDSTEGQVYCTGNGNYDAEFGGFGSYRMALEGTSRTMGEWSPEITLAGDCSRVPRVDPSPDVSEAAPEYVEPSPESVEPNVEAGDTQNAPSTSSGCGDGGCNAGGLAHLIPWLALIIASQARKTTPRVHPNSRRT